MKTLKPTSVQSVGSGSTATITCLNIGGGLITVRIWQRAVTKGSIFLAVSGWPSMTFGGGTLEYIFFFSWYVFLSFSLLFANFVSNYLREYPGVVYHRRRCSLHDRMHCSSSVLRASDARFSSYLHLIFYSSSWLWFYWAQSVAIIVSYVMRDCITHLNTGFGFSLYLVLSMRARLALWGGVVIELSSSHNCCHFRDADD